MDPFSHVASASGTDDDPTDKLVYGALREPRQAPRDVTFVIQNKKLFIVEFIK